VDHTGADPTPGLGANPARPGAQAFEAAGLYDPHAPGATERLELLHYLAASGVSLPAMIGADEAGRLGTLAAEAALRAPGPTLSVDEVATASHTSAERVLGLRLASGLPVSRDDDMLAPTVVDDMASFDAGVAMFGEAPTLSFTRVMGAAMARVAEAAVSLFVTERGPRVVAGAEQTGESGEAAMARAARNATTTFMAVIPSVMTNLLREHMARAVANSAVERAPDGDARAVTVGIGFVDLVGSTTWSSGLTLEEHARALTAFETAAWDITTSHGGRVVKLIGDEVMFVASTGIDAVRIARDLCRMTEQDPALPPARAAVGFGVVGSKDGDYFGPLVNLVARAMEVAGPSSVVVTEEVRAALPTPELGVIELSPLELRGITEPVRLFRLA
jgi:adenylate cyclase